MKKPFSLDWWMHQLYQHTKEFITNPTTDKETRLVSLITEYRQYHEKRNTACGEDEHEHLMDYQ